MGRYWLIAATSLLGIVSSLRADGDFAAQEVTRYLKLRSPDKDCTVKFNLDPSLSRDGEACSITSERDGLHIRGTNEFMLLYGGYAFLDALGDRFLAPNFASYQGSAEVLHPPPGPDLFMLDHPVVLKPKLRFRKLYVEEGHSHTIENLKQIVEWMPKVGYNTLVVPTNYQGRGRVMWDNWRKDLTPELQKRGITIEVGGHGYQNFLNAEMEDGKLFEQHAEFFGADKSGARQKAPSRVFCTSNPKAVDYLIEHFIAYVKGRPEIQIYDFWPPDGAKWCECEACQKLGSPSDRQAILVKQVQERVKAVRPDLRLEFIAYAAALNPPEHEKVDRNVLMDFCPINQQFDHQIDDASAEKNKNYADALQAWRKAFDGDISIYSYYRKYAWDSLPVIIPHYMQNDLRWYEKVPVQGVSTYAEPGDWFTYELNHYVLAALAWDPDADVDAIIKKFCAARYGSEADLAKNVFAALEKIVRVDCSIPNTSLKSDTEIAGARSVMNDLVEVLGAAHERAKDEAVKHNLHRLQLMCMYAARDLEIQEMRASNAPADQVKQKAAALHEWLSQYADEGVFLIKDQRLSETRMNRRYGTAGKGQ